MAMTEDELQEIRQRLGALRNSEADDIDLFVQGGLLIGSVGTLLDEIRRLQAENQELREYVEQMTRHGHECWRANCTVENPRCDRARACALLKRLEEKD